MRRQALHAAARTRDESSAIRAFLVAGCIALLGVVAGLLSAAITHPLYLRFVSEGAPFGDVLTNFVVQPGFGAVAAVYLWRTDGVSLRARIRWPSTEGLAWMAAGPLAYEAVTWSLERLLLAVGRDPFGAHGRQFTATWRVLLANPEVIVPAVLIMCLVMAPMEELLYRGVIHGELAGGFEQGGRIVIGAVLFGLVHLFLSAGIDSFVLTTGAGLIFAAGYERTNNLVVPVTIHGLVWLLLTPV